MPSTMKDLSIHFPYWRSVAVSLNLTRIELLINASSDTFDTIGVENKASYNANKSVLSTAYPVYDWEFRFRNYGCSTFRRFSSPARSFSVSRVCTAPRRTRVAQLIAISVAFLVTLLTPVREEPEYNSVSRGEVELEELIVLQVQRRIYSFAKA